MLDPGQRDRWVVIQSRPETEEVDAAGFPSPTWTELCGMWAERRQPSAAEVFKSNQKSASAIVIFEVNYRADLDPELVDVPKLRRVLYQTRIHDVIAADVVGRRDGIRLTTLSGMQVAA